MLNVNDHAPIINGKLPFRTDPVDPVAIYGINATVMGSYPQR